MTICCGAIASELEPSKLTCSWQPTVEGLTRRTAVGRPPLTTSFRLWGQLSLPALSLTTSERTCGPGVSWEEKRSLETVGVWTLTGLPESSCQIHCTTWPPQAPSGSEEREPSKTTLSPLSIVAGASRSALGLLSS